MAKTVLDALRGISAYPIPLRTLDEVAQRTGADLTGEATATTLKGKAYNLARAELLMWLAYAPDVSQGGQSYSFTDEQRTQFRNAARRLFDEYGDDSSAVKPIFGYKGSRL